MPAAGLLEADSRDTVLGLRASGLAIDDGSGGSGWRDAVGGKAAGLPFSMDESTESRNYKQVLDTRLAISAKEHAYTHIVDQRPKKTLSK